MSSDNRSKVIELTAANFETEVLDSNQPVVVDFWGQGCAPCSALAPTIDELADEYAGKIRVGKVDAGSHPELVSRYGVTSIPTVVLFVNGQPGKTWVGLHRKSDYTRALDAVNCSSGCEVAQ